MKCNRETLFTHEDPHSASTSHPIENENVVDMSNYECV